MGEGGENRTSASRWSLDGHQGNLPSFATVRDFLAVSLGDGLEKCATSSAFWLRLCVDKSLIILVSQPCVPVS